MSRRAVIKLGLLLRQNRGGLMIIGAWFALGLFTLSATLPGGVSEALLTTFYFRDDPSPWGTFYRNISGFVIFGLVVSMVMMNLQLRYRPEETCRLLAAEASDHCVVVGYSHFGQRVVEMLRQQQRPFVVVEAHRDRVDDLVEHELPLVLGDGRSSVDLDAASVSRARMVVVAEDDVETAVLVASLTRRVNPGCALVCRSFDAGVGEVLARQYKARLVSTSLAAAQLIRERAGRGSLAPALIVGANHVAQRVQRLMIELGWDYCLIDKDEKLLELLPDEERPRLLLGDARDTTVLVEANAAGRRLVFLAGENAGENIIIASRIRSMNSGCMIICRVFDERTEEVLRAKPFGCEVLSTSRQTVLSLVAEGVFAPVGVDAAQAAAALRAGGRA